jgi:manganese transport protein
VQTRKIEKNPTDIKRAIKFNFIDSIVALNLAFLVNASILILAAATFFKNGMFEVAEIQDAHKFLAPLIGNSLAPILFAVALIAAGQSSTITGTLAGQIVMEGYLNLRIAPWVRRLLTRLLAIIPAFAVIYIYGEESTGEMLVMSQVILSMQLGFAIIPMIHFVSDKKVMGEFVIGIKTKIAAWLCAAIIVSLNLKLVFEFAMNIVTNPEVSVFAKSMFIAILATSVFVLIYILIYPQVKKIKESMNLMPHGGFIQQIDFKTISYKSIAVTLDFSNWDVKAIESATAHGGKNAIYYLIHISESASAIVLGHETDDLESNEDLKILNQYKDYLREKGYNVEARLGFGNPKKSIPEIVNHLNPELLVMAAHGHDTFKDFLLGTTLDKVRHAVKTNILIVRD